MPLIEGLDDAVREEYGRFLDELRLAIAESGYNVTELCALAQIEPKTYYRLMAGNDVKLRDTAMRLLFAVGGRFEITPFSGGAPRYRYAWQQSFDDIARIGKPKRGGRRR